ncbi:MAG: hypothetical protein ABEJ68_04565 [Halobacteriaceae archaeon]
MVSRENATLGVGFLVGAACFVAAGVRGLESLSGLGIYLLATVATGIGPQLYLAAVDAATGVRLRVRTGVFVTGYLAALAMSPSMETTEQGRAAVAAFLGLLVGGLLTYEFVAGFYRREKT